VTALTDAPHHGWPVELYRQSIDANVVGFDNYGFLLSAEGGNVDSSTHLWNNLRSEFPLGDPPIVLGGLPLPAQLPPLTSEGSILDFTQRDIATSVNALMILDGSRFTMTTQSPVWLATSVDIADMAAYLAFSLDFSSEPGARGVLSVWLDDQLLGIADERFLVDGERRISLDGVAPGLHVLQFQLDSYDDVPSSVSIEDVRVAVIVPEPTSFVIAALACMSLLLRATRDCSARRWPSDRR